MKARIALDLGQRKAVADMLQEALAICREVGTQFCAPKVASALSRAVEDAKARAASRPAAKLTSTCSERKNRTQQTDYRHEQEGQ